jgi:RNA polymerase-interacting CarD/CdnL/TRCF family regulator
MIRKLNFKVGDLVKHRFINYGLGIIIQKRESISFGELLSSYVVHFPQEDLRRLVFSTEIDEAFSTG